MTAPKNRNELRDLIVTALSPVEINRVERANAILDALEAAGVACVPVEATKEMASPLVRLWLLSDQIATASDLREASGYIRAAIAASPYRKGEDQ